MLHCIDRLGMIVIFCGMGVTMSSKFLWVVLSIIFVPSYAAAQSTNHPTAVLASAAQALMKAHTDGRIPVKLQSRSEAADQLVATVAKRVGIAQAAQDEAFTCATRPCKLTDKHAVMIVSAPTIRGDSAMARIELVKPLRTDGPRQYSARVYSISLAHGASGWTVTAIEPAVLF